MELLRDGRQNQTMKPNQTDKHTPNTHGLLRLIGLLVDSHIKEETINETSLQTLCAQSSSSNCYRTPLPNKVNNREQEHFAIHSETSGRSTSEVGGSAINSAEHIPVHVLYNCTYDLQFYF